RHSSPASGLTPHPARASCPLCLLAPRLPRAPPLFPYTTLFRSRPGLTTATQYSGLPLPEPMRVPAGFSVTGLSGKILIQTLPPRVVERALAIRRSEERRVGGEGGDAGRRDQRHRELTQHQ